MTKVKICGLRRAADIDAANACLPDFIGFVFAKSKRMVAPAEAKALRQKLDGRIQAVGVFVNHDIAEIARLCADGTIGIVQLHGDEDAAYIAALRARVQNPVIRMVPVANTLPPLPGGVEHLLFDTLSPARGGTGEAFNWAALHGYTGVPYFLAGGLHAGNVREAVDTLHPYCVDVSSGVETDGFKDPAKMREFVGLVRMTSKEEAE